MKVGETVPVQIGTGVVAQAKIVLMEDGIATLEFPATRVQMSYVTQLAPEAVAPVEEAGTQTIITGIDRVDNEGNIIDSTSAVPVQAVESAPVVGNAENATNAETGAGSASATPTGTATQTEVVAPVVPAETPVVTETPSE